MAIRILLYGKSIFIAGIASILAGNPDLDLQRCNASDLDNLPAADIILADLCEAETLRVLPQLSVKLGCTLVGIDPATGATTVLSGTAHRMNSTQELMTFLQFAVLQAVPQINSNSHVQRVVIRRAFAPSGQATSLNTRLLRLKPETPRSDIIHHENYSQSNQGNTSGTTNSTFQPVLKTQKEVPRK